MFRSGVYATAKWGWAEGGIIWGVMAAPVARNAVSEARNRGAIAARLPPDVPQRTAYDVQCVLGEDVGAVWGVRC